MLSAPREQTSAIPGLPGDHVTGRFYPGVEERAAPRWASVSTRRTCGPPPAHRCHRRGRWEERKPCHLVIHPKPCASPWDDAQGHEILHVYIHHEIRHRNRRRGLSDCLSGYRQALSEGQHPLRTEERVLPNWEQRGLPYPDNIFY